MLLLALGGVAYGEVLVELARFVSVSVSGMKLEIPWAALIKIKSQTHEHSSIVTVCVNSPWFTTVTSLESMTLGRDFGVIVFLVVAQRDSASTSSSLMTSFGGVDSSKRFFTKFRKLVPDVYSSSQMNSFEFSAFVSIAKDLPTRSSMMCSG